jgi:hypothetical protein
MYNSYLKPFVKKKTNFVNVLKKKFQIHTTVKL